MNRFRHLLGSSFIRRCCRDAGLKPVADPSNRPTALLNDKARKKLQRRLYPAKLRTIVPPEGLSDAISACARDRLAVANNFERYVGTGQKIGRHLANRPLALDARGRVAAKEKCLWLARRDLKIDPLDPLDVALRARVDKLAEKYLAGLEKEGGALLYDETTAWAYLLGGCAAYDYATAASVTRELRAFDRRFRPKTHLDFGSGTGSVSWALDELYGSVREAFYVDVSPDMQDVARAVRSAKKGSSDYEPEIFRRLHFPAEEGLKYDLVTAAHALTELSASKDRLEVADALWRRVRVNGYLAVVERGTNAGFTVISEIRDYILQARDLGDADLEGLLAAPCPHDFTCPRYALDRIPCNFNVKYKNFALPGLPKELRDLVYADKYSYVIFKKTPKGEEREDRRLPRMVQDKTETRNTLKCQLCTREGALEEIFAHRRDKDLFRYLKSVGRGDRLEIELKDKVKED